MHCAFGVRAWPWSHLKQIVLLAGSQFRHPTEQTLKHWSTTSTVPRIHVKHFVKLEAGHVRQFPRHFRQLPAESNKLSTHFVQVLDEEQI